MAEFSDVKSNDKVFTIDNGNSKVSRVIRETKGRNLEFKVDDTWYDDTGRKYEGQAHPSCYKKNPFIKEGVVCPLPVGTDQVFWFCDNNYERGTYGKLRRYEANQECPFVKEKGTSWKNCRPLSPEERGRRL